MDIIAWQSVSECGNQWPRRKQDSTPTINQNYKKWPRIQELRFQKLATKLAEVEDGPIEHKIVSAQRAEYAV